MSHFSKYRNDSKIIKINCNMLPKNIEINKNQYVRRYVGNLFKKLQNLLRIELYIYTVLLIIYF